MTYRLGHACQTEKKGIFKLGKAGDQTGKEVYVRDFYENGWNYVLRTKTTAMANKIALNMTSACENNNIGYDQSERNTLLNLARSVKYDASKVGKPCETDCSALVTLCCLYAGCTEEQLIVGGNSCTTSTLRTKLVATGKFEAIKYVKGMKLYTGDIVLKEGTHVAVIVKGESRALTSSTKTKKMTSSFKVYANATDAKNKKNATATYESGTYTIKKTDKTTGSMLLSNAKHVSGGWYHA